MDNAALLAFSIWNCTYAIHKVKNDTHGHAELLKVEITIIVNVCEIPDSGELILAQLAVLEDGSCLISIKVSPTIGQRREDLPVLLYLCLFYSFV